jgi:hypothetical protein
MKFGIITLITALAIAGVAAWFSIAGLMAIFSAAALPIAVMAGTLEVGKLLTASWLYRYWNETSFALKSYLSIAVAILMLITSMGIFGYLSKAHLDQAGASGDAFAIVERIDGQISREENKISILQDRISSLDGSFDISDSVTQQEVIRDGAWDRVQGDIDYAKGQIADIRTQLSVDLKAQDDKLVSLDKIVESYANQGTTTVETDSGGIFRSAETEVIDNVAKAQQIRQEQKPQRDAITDEKKNLRMSAQQQINALQKTIDEYRAGAQQTIDTANKEINRLRNLSSQSQDDNLNKVDMFNTQIDNLYDGIVVLKDEKFEAETIVRELEKEVGPIKYVAQLIFGGDSEDLLDKAVQVFILLLVFVFDPLAVMLVIAANQTLLRYGVDLESSGPPLPTKPKQPIPEEEFNIDEATGREEIPSAVDDAATAMQESASQKKRLEEALAEVNAKYAETLKALEEKPKVVTKTIVEHVPKEVFVQVKDKETEKKLKAEIKDLNKQLEQKPKEVIKEIEVEKIVEKIVEVEIPKETVVTVEKEVPGPERVVEVPGPERVIEQEVEVVAGLREAAKMVAASDFNKEGYSEEELYEMLQKASEEDVKKKIGFWAMPLPNDDSNDEQDGSNKIYITKPNAK